MDASAQVLDVILVCAEASWATPARAAAARVIKILGMMMSNSISDEGST